MTDTKITIVETPVVEVQDDYESEDELFYCHNCCKEVHELFPNDIGDGLLCETCNSTCEGCDRVSEHLTEYRGGMLCDNCIPLCECCDESYGEVLRVNGVDVCEKCNNFECGVCYKACEDCDDLYDIKWCEKLQKCVCPECFKE